MKNVLIVLALNIFLSLKIYSYAFTMNNSARLAFGQDEVIVNVAAGLCTQIGISDEDLLSIVGKAVDNFWNKAPASRLKLRKGNLINVSGLYHSAPICQASTNCTPNSALAVSSDILITCNDNASNFPTNSILGITIPNNIAAGTIIGSLVMIGDNVGNQFATKNTNEKTSIIAHEIGHAIGLGHSPVADSLMYYATRDKRVALGRDDLDGLSYLYPKEQPFSGCGTIDLDSNQNPPQDWWGGMLIGLGIIGIFKSLRQKIKLDT